jgi:hypothetical protein
VPRLSDCWSFEITLRHTTFGRIPLDKWSARRLDLYLTIHNIHKRQTSVPPAEFRPAILASQWPLTHALDRAATGIGTENKFGDHKLCLVKCVEASRNRMTVRTALLSSFCASKDVICGLKFIWLTESTLNPRLNNAVTKAYFLTRSLASIFHSVVK